MENITYRVEQLQRWRAEVEALKPDVIADRLTRLDGRVDTLIRVFTALMLGLIAALGGTSPPTRAANGDLDRSFAGYGTNGRVIGDPLRLGQILINYANNAVKFTEHGEISIILRQTGETDDAVQILQQGGVELLRKPFRMNELWYAVNKSLGVNTGT